VPGESLVAVTTAAMGCAPILDAIHACHDILATDFFEHKTGPKMVRVHVSLESYLNINIFYSCCVRYLICMEVPIKNSTRGILLGSFIA
jgi:hypothetical protein